MRTALLVSSFLLGGRTCSSACPAYSHHSNVAYNDSKRVTVTGVVREWRWVNPHTWLYLEVNDEKAGKIEWHAEGRAPGVLLRAGWSKTSFQPGETVTVDMRPAKDGSYTGIMMRATKADGTVLGGQPNNQ